MGRINGKKVFICSPFRPRGDTMEEREKDWNRNLRWARRGCRYAMEKGYIPYAPHLYFPQFLSDGEPEEREMGIRLGLTWLAQCDELWVVGYRVSEGMEREIEKAQEWGIKVKHYVPKRTAEERILDAILHPEMKYCEMI